MKRLLCSVAVFCLLSGCALPRIIVLEDPLTAEEHLNLGVAYEKRGEDEPALKEYQAAAKELPIAHLYVGNACFRLNRFDEAEEHYRKVISKEPRNADAHNNLAWMYYTKKVNLADAEAHAVAAIELNPGKSDLYTDTLERIRELRRETEHANGPEQ